MSNSFSQQRALSCPRCGHPFIAEIWLIIDTSERIDLLERIKAKSEHQDRCARCGFEGSVDAPILLFRPGEDPALVFSPAKETTDEQNQEWLNGLLRLLRESLSSVWQEAWVRQIATVPRPQLAAFLSGKPAAIEPRKQEQPQLAVANRHLQNDRKIDPIALAALIEEFIKAGSRDHAKTLLETHPELLSEAADWMMAAFCFEPMGSRFEASLGLLYDALILLLMDRLVISAQQMFARHANLA